MAHWKVCGNKIQEIDVELDELYSKLRPLLQRQKDLEESRTALVQSFELSNTWKFPILTSDNKLISKVRIEY